MKLSWSKAHGFTREQNAWISAGLYGVVFRNPGTLKFYAAILWNDRLTLGPVDTAAEARKLVSRWIKARIK